MYFARGFPGCQVTLPKVNENKSGNSIKNCCYGVTSSTLNCKCFVSRVFNSEVCHGYPMLLKELGHTNVKVQWVDGLHAMEVIL